MFRYKLIKITLKCSFFIGRGDWRAACDTRGGQRGLCGHSVCSHCTGAHHGELKASLGLNMLLEIFAVQPLW
jgi:hypothetical protein